MRYMIIVKATRDTEAGVMPEEPLRDAMAGYHEALMRAGVLLDASGLKPSAHGWRIRFHGSARSMTDGPFAEHTEMIAGYTLIQVNSREEALEWTRRFPNPAGDGVDTEIDVRQLFEMDDCVPGEAIDRFRAMDGGGA